MDFLKVPPGYFPPFDSSFVPGYTQSPNPQWTYGQNIQDTPEGRAWMAGEKEGWKVVDTSTEPPMCVLSDSMTAFLMNYPRKLYQLMVSGIVPRPIAFVSSVSEAGVENLAPFSWFNMV